MTSFGKIDVLGAGALPHLQKLAISNLDKPVGSITYTQFLNEKGFLYWSGDMTPDDNPYEAGLGFCLDLDKGDFMGRQAFSGPPPRHPLFDFPFSLKYRAGMALISQW